MELVFSKAAAWDFGLLHFLKHKHDPFPSKGGIPLFFLRIYFFWTFFSSVCCCQYELLYVLFWYFSILISFNVLVHKVNVTEVDVSVKIELWQRSISHDWSKLNICIFDVYIYIHNITFFFCKILFYHFSYGYLNLLECRYVVILLNFMLSFETVLF